MKRIEPVHDYVEELERVNAELLEALIKTYETMTLVAIGSATGLPMSIEEVLK